jgi:hypothetical protein
MGTDSDRTIFKLGIASRVGVVSVVVVFGFEPRRFSRPRATSRNDMVNELECSLLYAFRVRSRFMHLPPRRNEGHPKLIN